MVADSSGETPSEAQKTEMTTASAWAAQCLLTVRDAKLHMNAVAKSRGHFDPPPSVPHSGYGSSKAQGKNNKTGGKGSKGFCHSYDHGQYGPSKSQSKSGDSVGNSTPAQNGRRNALRGANVRCLACGQLGH